MRTRRRFAQAVEQLFDVRVATVNIVKVQHQAETARSRRRASVPVGRNFWWASLIFRMTSTAVILAAVAIRRPSLAVQPLQVPLLALIGIGDMLGNLLFAAASTSGLVSITSVLASLYPIVTVILARVVLRERVARSQEAGIVLTLAGVALISAG